MEFPPGFHRLRAKKLLERARTACAMRRHILDCFKKPDDGRMPLRFCSIHNQTFCELKRRRDLRNASSLE